MHLSMFSPRRGGGGGGGGFHGKLDNFEKLGSNGSPSGNGKNVVSKIPLGPSNLIYNLI